MTEPEFTELVAWAKREYFPRLSIAPGMVRLIHDDLRDCRRDQIQWAVREYASDNLGKTFVGDDFWPSVVRRCRSGAPGYVVDGEINEHGHSPAVIANIAREVKRKRGNVDLSAIADAEAYRLFLVWNGYILHGPKEEYPGCRYGASMFLDPHGPGPMSEENRLALIRGLKFKTAKPEQRRSWLKTS